MLVEKIEIIMSILAYLGTEMYAVLMNIDSLCLITLVLKVK